MFLRDSRYQDALPFTGEEDSRFQGVRPREIGPAEGVIEHVIKRGDRLDLLARNYYNDDRRWWRILDANPDILYGGDLLLDNHEGEIILIPKSKES